MNTKYLRRGVSALAAFALLAGLLAGCAAEVAPESEAAANAGPESEAQGVTPSPENPGDDKFSWSEADATAVVSLNGDSISVEGGGAAANGSVLTISSAGTYVLRGTLNNGQIVVDAGKEDTVRLVLDGVDISCSDSAPVYSASSEETVVILADGSQNTLSDGERYVYAGADDDEPDAALFAKDDLRIGGSGALIVTALFNNGIGSKDDLVIAGGTITVDAANHAIRGRDSLTITGGVFTLTAGNDGLQSNNSNGADVGWIAIDGGTFTIHAAHDAVQAETSLAITGGEFTITTANGHAQLPTNTLAGDDSDSYKALKAGGDVVISGGTFVIDAADDAIHGNGDVTISDGAFTISTGDDGIHADGDTLITGGAIDILTSYEGIEGGTVTIRGGTISLVATDDGINAAGGSDASADSAFGGDSFRGGPGGSDVSEDYVIRFEGGTVEIDAAGDGFDSNGSVYMSGGTVTVHGPTSGRDGAVDYELTFGMTGGTLIAAGASGMAMGPTANASSQPSLMVFFTENLAAGETVTLKDESGSTVASYISKKSFDSIVISSPDMADGETYGLYVGGSQTGSVTLAGMLTSVDESGEAASGGMMGFGGGPGGNPGGEGGDWPSGDMGELPVPPNGIPEGMDGPSEGGASPEGVNSRL